MSAPADNLISGQWLIEMAKVIIPSIFTGGAAWIVAMRQNAKRVDIGKAPAVELKEPVPEIPIRRVYTPPTFAQHRDLERRVAGLETDLKEVRREAAESFRRLLDVGEERKDKIMERIETVAVGFHQRVNQIVSEMHADKKR